MTLLLLLRNPSPPAGRVYRAEIRVAPTGVASTSTAYTTPGAVGHAVPKGVAASSVAYTPVGVGHVRPSAAASTSWGVQAAAYGHRTPRGVASAGLTYSAAAEGRSIRRGHASSAVVFTGVAQGVAPVVVQLPAAELRVGAIVAQLEIVGAPALSPATLVGELVQRDVTFTMSSGDTP